MESSPSRRTNNNDENIDDETNLLLSPPSARHNETDTGNLRMPTPPTMLHHASTSSSISSISSPLPNQRHDENTPLLQPQQKKPSISFAPTTNGIIKPRRSAQALGPRRRSFAGEHISEGESKPRNGGTDPVRGNSTFGQSVRLFISSFLLRYAHSANLTRLAIQLSGGPPGRGDTL